MRNWLRILSPCIFAVFLVLTLWRIVFQGLLEKPSFEASHLDAGAGDFGLVLALCLAAVAVALAVAWFFVESRRKFKASAVVLALITPAMFAFSARGLQRFAPGYSEMRWQALEALHDAKSPLQAADITAALGDPLMRRKLQDEGEDWLYSYMPSCGFGWDKKYVSIDRSGGVTAIFTITEP